MIRFLIALALFVFPSSGVAAAELVAEFDLSGHDINTNGASVTHDRLRLDVLQSTSEAAHIVLSTEESIAEQELPRLPNGYRSKQEVFSYALSGVDATSGTVFIERKSRKRPLRRRRLFYLAPDADSWQRLRTVVDMDTGVYRAALPSQGGQLVLATHRSKKEQPIKQVSFESHGALPHSKAGAVMDPKSGRFLYRYKAKEQRSIASLSKIATAITVLQTNPELSSEHAYQTLYDRIGATVPLEDGEVVTLEDMLIALLLPSANNMAVQLSHSTSIPHADFAATMNTTVRNIGLKKTVFHEPSGLDSRNQSTAGNITRLARYAFATYPDLFESVADMRTYPLQTNREEHILYSTNTFNGRGVYDVVAFKTGYLPGSADRTYTAKIQEIDTGHEIILTLLGNPQYGTIFDEAYALAEWSFANWEFHNY